MKSKKYSQYDIILSVLTILCVIVGIGAIVFLWYMFSNTVNTSRKAEEEFRANLVEKSHSYTCYINGVETDINHINTGAYTRFEVSIDDMNHTILIRDKHLNNIDQLDAKN